MSAMAIADPSESMTERRLPRIDYVAHPAYGGMFRPTRKRGLAAAAQLQPFIEEVEKGERERVAQFGYRHGGGMGLSRKIGAHGFCVRQMEPALFEPLHLAAMPVVADIRERMAVLRADGQLINFKATQEYVGPDRHGELWSIAAAAVERTGVTAASADYFGAAAAKLKSAAVMVNPPDQDWCTRLFSDLELETPPTVGMHIDSPTYCTLKIVLYLDDVGPDQGPFGVIPTSHLWDQGGIDRIRRRAFDRSPLVSRALSARHKFTSLPPELQVKAEFGGDLLVGAPETDALLAAERVMTGPRGQMNIFDPEAIHRGGHARAGERLVMLLSIAARWPLLANGASS